MGEGVVVGVSIEERKVVDGVGGGLVKKMRWEIKRG